MLQHRQGRTTNREPPGVEANGVERSLIHVCEVAVRDVSAKRGATHENPSATSSKLVYLDLRLVGAAARERGVKHGVAAGKELWPDRRCRIRRQVEQRFRLPAHFRDSPE